jgi:hypothetical protein
MMNACASKKEGERGGQGPRARRRLDPTHRLPSRAGTAPPRSGACVPTSSTTPPSPRSWAAPSSACTAASPPASRRSTPRARSTASRKCRTRGPCATCSGPTPRTWPGGGCPRAARGTCSGATSPPRFAAPMASPASRARTSSSWRGTGGCLGGASSPCGRRPTTATGAGGRRREGRGGWRGATPRPPRRAHTPPHPPQLRQRGRDHGAGRRPGPDVQSV